MPSTRTLRSSGVSCILRNSLRFIAWKDYKAVTRDLKLVYRAATEETALQALDEFSEVGIQRHQTCHQETQSIPDRRICEKSGVAGHPVSITAIDSAISGLAYGNKPLYYRVC